jgi:hypothetical protein
MENHRFLYGDFSLKFLCLLLFGVVREMFASRKHFQASDNNKDLSLFFEIFSQS